MLGRPLHPRSRKCKFTDSPQLIRLANKHNRTFPQRYHCPLPPTLPGLASDATCLVQKTPHTRQNRPNSLFRQPHIPLRLHFPPQPSPRPATSKRRLRHLCFLCCSPPTHRSIRSTHRSTPHPHRFVKSSHAWRPTNRFHTRPYHRTPRRP